MWAIALRFYAGEGHRERAQKDLAWISSTAGRSDLRVRTRERGSVIVAGRYSGPGDANALSELERLKAITSGDSFPFAKVYLAPPLAEQAAGTGAASELDLAGAKARYGNDRAVYTLEYASYDEGSSDAYQRAAAAEAKRLRQEGELAFFYHGRFNSSVTIGLFGADAVDASDRFSPEVDFLQRRYKFMMKNDERIEMAQGTYWPTRLVRVPG